MVTANPHAAVIDPENSALTALRINQDDLLGEGMGVLLPQALDSPAVCDILDLACGPGGWARAAAAAWPERSVVGIDASARIMNYARAFARVQRLNNAAFEAMDVTHPLTLEDASFDLVNARLLCGVVPLSAWPELLAECKRVLRRGGALCMTESERPFTNSPALEHLHGLFASALQSSGYSPATDGGQLGITPLLARLLRGAGYRRLGQQVYIISFSFGTPLHFGFYQHIRSFLLLLAPFLIRMGVTSEEEFLALHEQMELEVSCEGFCGTLFMRAVWGWV